MKKLIYTLFFVLISVVANGQAKYVFYFIGDGMGVNQVNGTEMYQAELQNGRIGVEPLLFTQFPVATMATTFSATNSVTDSAAAGTALATGKKTYNSAISVGEDKNPIETVAEKAKKAGKKVGVTTSVSVDHATPAAFYAHQADRNMNYEIAVDLTKANFDFYAGGGFLKPDKTYDKKDAPSIFPIFEEAGYTVARGYSDYKAKSKDAGKMILIQEEGKDPSCLPYAIDRKSDDLTLAQITESAIDFLTKGKNKGFFLMVEGARIDKSAHNNDYSAVVREVLDFDKAVEAAIRFAEKDGNTLVIISADHETGALALRDGNIKEGKMKAIVSITLDNEFVIHDIKVIEGEKGLFIAMPSRKAADGEYRDIAHPINSETRDMIQNVILHKYEMTTLEAAQEALEG